MGDMITRSRLALAAAALLAIAVVPVAFAGSDDPQATASGVKGKVKKLSKRVAQLEAEQGGPRPPSGPAGGDFNGTYPNPLIAANAVSTGKIADNAVSTGEIADGAVAATKLADGAVTAPKLGDGSVVAAKLGTVTERSASVLIADGTGDSVQVSCNAGERVISGGTNTAGVGTAAGWSTIRNDPTATGWDAAARNETGSPGTLIVEVLCLAV